MLKTVGSESNIQQQSMVTVESISIPLTSLRIHNWSNLNTDESNHSHHERLYKSLITFTYHIIKTYIPYSYGRIHLENYVLISQESIIIILIAYSQEYYIEYSLLWSKICHMWHVPRKNVTTYY